MMPPGAYRDFRLRARDHIQGEIFARQGSFLTVRVRRVFRGPIRKGAILTLGISILPDEPVPVGGTLYMRPETVDRARFLEAFLDGDPPVIVGDQVKFIDRISWFPQGDPRVEGATW